MHVQASSQLALQLSSIVPKLFRYQFDPNEKIKVSLPPPWVTLKPSPGCHEVYVAHSCSRARETAIVAIIGVEYRPLPSRPISTPLWLSSFAQWRVQCAAAE